MKAKSTSEQGFNTAWAELKKHGAEDIEEKKEGRKRYIVYQGTDGREYKILTRSKRSPAWQTDISYGKPRAEKEVEVEFWLFVDLLDNPPSFYPVPTSWISNNIYEIHQKYTQKYEGERKFNNESTHHAIGLERIKDFKSQWNKIGLNS